MKFFVVQALILALVVLMVSAFVFRSRRARDILRTMRNALLIYIALIFALGIVTLIRRNM